MQDWLLHDTDFNWRVLADEGGELRAVADIGTHWLDLRQFVTGLKVDEVCADLRTVLPTRQRPKGSVETFSGKLGDAADTRTRRHRHRGLRLRPAALPAAARGVFTVSQVTAGRKNCLRFEIAGSQGRLAWDSERPNELWLGHRDRPNELLVRDPALLQPTVRPFANYPGGHNEGFPDTFKQLFRAVYEHIDARQHGAAAVPDVRRRPPRGGAVRGDRPSHRERRWVQVV